MVKKKRPGESGTSDTSSLSCGTGTCCNVEAVLSIDERGQMVLPKEVRQKARIATGDKLALISWERNGEVCCLALIKVGNLSGMVKGILNPLVQDLNKE
jgi:AbrB family looped-hinge helix DNA binding protein